MKLIVQTTFAEKLKQKGARPSETYFSSMADFSDVVVSVMPSSPPE